MTVKMCQENVVNRQLIIFTQQMSWFSWENCFFLHFRFRNDRFYYPFRAFRKQIKNWNLLVTMKVFSEMIAMDDLSPRRNWVESYLEIILRNYFSHDVRSISAFAQLLWFPMWDSVVFQEYLLSNSRWFCKLYFFRCKREQWLAPHTSQYTLRYLFSNWVPRLNKSMDLFEYNRLSMLESLVSSITGE